jgi:squalene synthase HpnC
MESTAALATKAEAPPGAAVDGGIPAAPGLGVPRRAENFPLAWLCKPELRRRRLAVYGFCRLVDDIGDELHTGVAAALDAADAELRAAVRGRARHPVFRALTPLFDEGMAVEPFQRLIEANRWDQVVHRYERWQDLDAYCSLSASPVGEIVLRLENAASPSNLALSARICAGLQLINHWQDLAEDAERGRCYVPRPVLERHGVTVRDLAQRRASPQLASLVDECVEQARQRLAAGWPLVAALRGRLRAEIAGFAAHGSATCDAVAKAGADVAIRRPSSGRSGRASAMAVAVRSLIAPRALPRSLRTSR